METLRKRADFLALRGSEAARTPGFVLARRRRGDGDTRVRVGFTVTKKVGNAVVRNRIRRRLRAAARLAFAASAEPGADYVLIARAAAETRAFADLLDDMNRALLRLSHNPT